MTFKQFVYESKKRIGSKPVCNNIICFTKMLRKDGFISKNELFKVRVLIKGDGDELKRTFDIEVPDIILNKQDFDTSKDYTTEIENWKDYEVSVDGWNLNGEEIEWREIFYSEIEEVIKDLNETLKVFELVDYGKVDFSELDTYTGNLYLYSKTPKTLKGIKRLKTLTVFPHNRASASEIDHEYIYQIKVNKPLYKRTIDNYFDEINVDNYSGYFSKEHFFGLEWAAFIKTSDIISFKSVGGFVKYDKHKPAKLKKKISHKTDMWLSQYISGSLLLTNLTNDIIKELEPFKPIKPLKIFRGLEEVEIEYYTEIKPPYKKGQIIEINYDRCKSWTTNPLMARRFVDEYPSSQPLVVTMIAEPEDMLVDVQMLPTMYYHTNQREIIIKPGEWKFKIVWVGEW